ncbi:MAG: DUF4215 domain-containing protein [Kofleriaceae bacterium]
MRRVLLAVVLAVGTAHASRPHGTFDVMTAPTGKPLRTHAELVRMETPPVAWMALASQGTWDATWDAALGVPRQIFGKGPITVGANADATIAEAAARALLADHLALLAPGSSTADWRLVSNQTDGDIRTVAFAQYANGMRVIGGQLSFWWKRDRLIVISSQAFPNVVVDPTVRLAVKDPSVQLQSLTGVAAAAVPAGERKILPLVGDHGLYGYRAVTPYEQASGADRYLAYVDGTGVVAVQQQNEFVTGTVNYLGSVRYPGKGHSAYPAKFAHESIAGAAVTSDANGLVTWGGNTISIETTTGGDYVLVQDSVNPLAVFDTTIDPDGSVVWDATAVEANDAQVNAYINVNIAKEFVRANVDPAMATLNDTITANVNLAQDCNAYFDGSAVNFFHRTAMCENTGLIQDVIFHEYGHRVHTAEIIDGVGSFDSAMSEGVADFLAVSITGDSGMGRGFFFTDDALRELNPPDKEWTWPVDIGEIHHTGMIIGGTLWDLRASLISTYGMDAGVALTEKLYVGALRRSIDIPTSLLAVLAADDDDGDLTNGTPNECAIRDAYGRHGLRTVTGTIEAPGTIDNGALSVGIVVDVSGLSTRCMGDTLDNVKVDYVSDDHTSSGTLLTTGNGSGQWFAQLPLVDYSPVRYHARVNFADGSVFVLPDNLADPYYQIYSGHTVPLYCTDFEDKDPFTDGWVGSASGSNGPTDSPWQWGTPTGGATDPHAAYSGSKIIAQVLDGDYPPLTTATLSMPVIDVGLYTDVRLQYRRWLAVEDSHYDKAQVLANGTSAWINYTANMGDSSSTHHIDKEWRFADVALTPFFYGHKLHVQFQLASDPGLEFGGWQIDDVCVVANPNSVCGDGIKSPTETCDDGSANADEPDKCRTWCKSPACGDGIVDSNEECDDAGATATCSATCKIIAVEDGGCCSTGGNGASSALLGFVVLLAAGRRRRDVRLI